MAKTKISEFSSTPGNNTDIDSINIAEGCAPSGINNAIRELMAQLKDFQTGAAGDSFNGPIGTTTAAAGAFTTLSASSTVSGTGFSNYLASPPAIGGTAAAAGSFTTLTTSSTVTLNGGTANGVAYLNGSKVLTSGSALTFDGSNLETTGNTTLANNKSFRIKNTGGTAQVLLTLGNDDNVYMGQVTNPTAGALFSYGSQQIFYTGASEQMRLTSTGLGIGTSSPATKLQVNGVIAGASTGVDGTFAPVFNALYSSDPTYYGQIQHSMSSVATASGFRFMGGGTSNIAGSGGLQKMLDLTRGQTIFYTGDTERARIDSSGNFLIGTTSASNRLAVVGTSAAAHIAQFRDDRSDGASGAGMIVFDRSGSTVGSISTTTSSTSYNTSSDYRLKDNPQPLIGSGEFIDSLQPKTWNWKVDGSKGVGFLAHEAQAISPSSVTGAKDAVDEEGKPVMQAMEYGSAEFIANIIAEIQSLRQRLAALEAA